MNQLAKAADPTRHYDRLRAVRGFVFDMDGTLVLGDKRNNSLTPLPGALELLAELKHRGVPYVVFTNGTARSPLHYANVLRDAGFELADEQMMTPASSAADIFQRSGYVRIMALGGAALAEPLREVGIEVIEPDDYSPGMAVDAVLIGWFRDFHMESLEKACAVIEAGAKLYTSSEALYFAAAGGRALGTSRVIAAMIHEVTGCQIHTVGKPSLQAVGCAAARMGVEPREMAVVGDDPVLETPMAHRGNALAIAVATGLASPEDFAALPPGEQPHLMLSGVDELLSLYRELA